MVMHGNVSLFSYNTYRGRGGEREKEGERKRESARARKGGGVHCNCLRDCLHVTTAMMQVVVLVGCTRTAESAPDLIP